MRTYLPLLALLLAACPPSGEETDTTETDTDRTETDTESDTETSEIPDDAWGRASDEPLLPSAVLLDEDDLDDVGGSSFLRSPAEEEQRRRQAASDLEDDEQVVRAWITDQQLERSTLARLLDAAPDDTRDLTELPDGNYDLIVRDPDTQEPLTRVVTMGRDELFRGLRRSVDKLRDPQNHLDTYVDLYRQLPEELTSNLISPDDARQLPDDDWFNLTYDLSSVLDRAEIYFQPPGGRPPAGRPTSCDGEDGAGNNSDRTMGAANASSFSATGIYANHVWPLKWYATCVKDQANRGTCGSFGISAAMETAVALRENRWINLSEQDLYFRLRGEWNTPGYGDGLNTHASWQQMITEDYLQPFEEQWPYNPSRSRVADDETMTYTGSCTNYQFPPTPSPLIPNFCSDTVHQGGEFCVNVGFFQFCGAYSPVSEDNTSGYRASSETELWNPADTDLSLALTHLALVLKKPAVLWAFVTPSFDAATNDGFVTYVGDDESDRGSHIYQITGVITNNQLVDILPNAPEGAGGGYVIAKNSWGDAWADAGYVYLPFDWVKKYAISVTLLHDIQ